MKILSIELQNVRRFVAPARIDGFGPGLNVLTAPNEHGKSTFFDAVHAVFFVSHRSNDKTVKKLTPKVGGDPSVAVEFETEGSVWRLKKTWSSSAGRREAKLSRDGTLVAQAAEAELQLSQLLKSPDDGGPAGLLWVRQGLVGLEASGKEQAARRDIMTSVAGEVEAMTGGRRMEHVIARCNEFLSQHLTPSGQEKKTGGLKGCKDRLEGLVSEKERLETEVRNLTGDLERRRQVRSELKELESSEAKRERQDNLAKAEKSFASAEKHKEKCELARGKVATLAAKLDKLVGASDALKAATDELEVSRTEYANAETAANEAADVFGTTEDAFNKAHETFQILKEKAEAASSVLRDANQEALSKGATERRLELTDRLEKAEDLSKQVEAAETAIRNKIPANVLSNLEKLEQDATLTRLARENASASFVLSYSPETKNRVFRNGSVVPEAVRHPLAEGVELDLVGIGRMEIHPAAEADEDAAHVAAEALSDALKSAGFPDLPSARTSAGERVILETELRDAKADLKAAAPNGLAVLRQSISDLPEPVEENDELPTVSEAEEAEMAARDARNNASETMEAERARLLTHRDTNSRLQAVSQTAKERLARAEQLPALQGDPAASLKQLSNEIEALEGRLATAQSDLAAFEKDSPDIEASRVALKRAKSAIDRADKLRNDLREENAQLDARISIMSSNAVEEELALVQEQEQEAQSRLDAVEFEIAVNNRLITALKSAQADSLDRYVAPVHAELLPLLRMIWPDAEPAIDAETGMITNITRRNLDEDFDILSGGTQEQISLLVRLAFARMLARNGNPAPVFLDDAIVYTDDDRIEQMFNALTRQSEDLQIIVFSCRQRAFRSLGGEALTIERKEVAA